VLLTFVINSVLIAGAVLVHFEVLSFLGNLIPKLPARRRLNILIGVFGAFFAHVIEIWPFAVGYYVAIHYPDMGALVSVGVDHQKTLMDCVYFSFTSYTSLGFGDIYPEGNLRFLAGLEALTGLLLIAWTASFMYIEMQKLWKIK